MASINEKQLLRISGLQTAESVAEKLKITRQSALNLVSRLKKAGHVVSSGGGKQKRIYTITTTKHRIKQEGLFDMINKYSPMKVVPLYDHQVHGRYTPEDALVDALETKNFRVILASMRLFGHINNWSKLYAVARKKDCWKKLCALYSVAKQFVRVRKMPKKYELNAGNGWVQITQLKTKNFPEISEKYKVYIPFNKQDMEEIK